MTSWIGSQDRYIDAARLGVQGGFRAFDMKVTHGYLLSELMGAKTREGKYGGGIENRLPHRFAVVLAPAGGVRTGDPAVHAARVASTACRIYRSGHRLGVPLPYPMPYPWGFGVNADNPMEPDLTEVKAAIGLFRACRPQLLNVSLGCPTTIPTSAVRSRRPMRANLRAARASADRCGPPLPGRRRTAACVPRCADGRHRVLAGCSVTHRMPGRRTSRMATSDSWAWGGTR